MKYINLTQGKQAIIDDEDFERVNQYKWYAYKVKKSLTFYARRSSRGHTIHLHRFILNIIDNKIRLDHKNRNGLDNRKENLRIADQSQNMINYVRKNKTGYRGVSQRGNTYFANLEIKGKDIFLGNFKTAQEAALAYNRGAIKHFGEFAILNKI